LETVTNSDTRRVETAVSTPARTDDPHGGQSVLRFGPDPDRARLAAVLAHGRGGSAQDMLALARDLRTTDVLYLAPQAAANTWYPKSFLAPIEDNEPWLGSALRFLARVVGELGRRGFPPDRVALIGFSQGACLTLELGARNARRYAAVIGLSGGVIGPAGTLRSYGGSLQRTPVLLGCSDDDPHIPLARVHETAEVFRSLGAMVDERIYPGLGHTVNRDELDATRELLVRAD
jgi:predicted esterase